MPHPAEMEPDVETAPGLRPAIRWRLWLIFGVVVLGLAFIARYLWIEPSTMGLACAALPTPQWCRWREGVILIHQANGWGLAALAGGIAAIVLRWRWTVALGLAAGLIGLVLYNAGLAAVGLLLALLRLLRP
jgi:hypothetical protein